MAWRSRAKTAQLSTNDPQSFNYFKLHGSLAYGNDPHFGHNASFRLEKTKRLEYLADKSLQFDVPPVVFPWELFDGDSGKFISEDDFVLVKEGKDIAAQEKARLLFRQLMSIWENTKRVLSRANKISFVGLSMHEYLESGLRYLFNDNGVVYPGGLNQVQVVVANPDNDQFRNAENRLHPASLCGKVADLLKRVAPNINYVRSSSEYDGMFRSTDSPHKTDDPDITPRYSFAEFIEREMR